MSEFWKVDIGHDIALCSQISQDNHYCFLFLGKMSVWGKVLTNVGYPWCSPCQAEGDNRSLFLERTFTHRNLQWRGMLPAWGIYANGLCNEDGSSGSHYWCENRGFSMLWNCTVFWCLPGRNVTEGQIAHADSQCSQPSDSTHNTALHAICKTLTPVWALSSQEPPLFLEITYLSPTARNFSLITTIKTVFYLWRLTQVSEQSKKYDIIPACICAG